VSFIRKTYGFYLKVNETKKSMDIKIPHSLITNYLTTNAKPKDIARCLSLCGPTVDRLEKTDDDWIYHIEVITNRVDAASALGISREASAILPEFSYTASLKPPKRISPPENQDNLDIDIINNPALNHRVLAIKIAGVTTGPSPQWLGEAVEKCGSRQLNNIIDVTNYVMYELGHPVHAFDYDRITTKKIIIREANKGEVITTLDNITHTLIGGEIVYDDGTGTLIDLPGIMGTANSVITKETKNVLLWIEANDPIRIRKASLSHQIRSHAAILNEKGVDPNLGLSAILRAADLMCQVGNGEIGSNLYDYYPSPLKTHSVDLDLNWLSQFAGVTITNKHAAAILQKLGFTVTAKPKNILSCQVPSWRQADITIKEDLAEEIMRVYGYYRLPSVLPATDIPAIGTDPALSIEQLIRQCMKQLGFTEIYNYSLISESLLTQHNINPSTLFRLQNPLSEEFQYMRPTLTPSLLQNISFNRNNSSRPIKLFELANVYHRQKQGKLADEVPTLAAAMLGVSYREAKGLIESLYQTFHVSIPKQPLTRHYQDVLVMEINLREFINQASLIHSFTPIPQTPPIIEDLTFTLPAKTAVGPIIDSITNSHTLITKVDLKGIYNQNYTFTITYQSDQKNLATEDIAPIRKQIVNALEKEHITLVGQI
jgi:phenylalanyl-tRNA synthetase beta chain